MTKILHFGPGNFFRAHLAEYTFDAGGWSIDVVSLRSATFANAFAAHGPSYTLAVQGRAARQIDVISDVYVAPDDPEAIVDRVADPQVPVISATVTEKGYHLAGDGRLDLNDPTISAELSGPPCSFIGFLAKGLARRSAPATVLSCDNRVGNGDALALAVRDFAAAAGLDITCDVRFPNAMIDRITPASTQDLIDAVGDPLVVPCEAFKEWVIKDDFAGPRPDWPGVLWVNDVAPHELRKLRMLNGAHSYLAYAGVLKGHSYVHEAVTDPDLRAGVQRLMSEAAATLPEVVRAQAAPYAEALIARFENPHLNHALRQIAMDGTQKLPYRIVDSLRARGDAASPSLVDAMRAWVQFCRAETAAGRSLQDPKAEALARAQSDKDYLQVIGAEDILHLL